jgi:hypothetical protein
MIKVTIPYTVALPLHGIHRGSGLDKWKEVAFKAVAEMISFVSFI